MGRIRKHLQNKSTEDTGANKDAGKSKPKKRVPVRKRAQNRSSSDSSGSTTKQTPKTAAKIAPKIRKKSRADKIVEPETVTQQSQPTETVERAHEVGNASDTSSVNVNVAATDSNKVEADVEASTTPRPRVHAAPSRMPKPEENVITEPTVSDNSETAVNAPEPKETKESKPPNVKVEAEVANTTDSDVKSEASSSENDAASTDTEAPKSGSRSRVHAAPPEAYLRVQQAVARKELGSAVISPPASSTSTTSDKKKGAAKWEESKENDKSKTTKSKRGRRRSRDWSAMASTDSETPSYNPRRRNRRRKGPVKASPKAKAIKRRVMIDGTITVADLAHAMSQKSGSIIKKLIGFGEMATINDSLDFDTASTIAAEFEFEAVDTSFQEDEFLITEEKKQEGELRAPVVTIMGHVDHGKTTLLDTIRKANVAGGEAGGITQHTSAYQVSHEDQLITFIDTPGHEAFTAMRARGAQVTDIVILVVAADDGPMPQTIEALNHARASGVQLMVAVNKCDKPGADPNKVRQDMMRYELVSEEYGGDTIFVNVSALKGEGIDELLENITLLSEMGEYRSPVDRHAEGFVLEARLEKGRGAVATLLVKSGTLKKGDTLVLGNVWGRVRAMYDYNGKTIKKALPSTPVELIGLQDIPAAGDDFVVVKKPKDAKALVAHRAEEAKQKAQLAASNSVSLEELLRRQVEGEPVKLNLVIKSDVGGTLEAMKGSIAQIEVPGTEVNILHAAIGGITESDVSLAHTYDGIIIGFNVRPDAKARKVVNQTNVEVRTYSVIYEALEDLEKGLKGLLEPEIKEQWKGSAEIRETFSVPKVGTVAGCFVLDGSIARKHRIRLLRDGTIMWEGKLASLRRFKDDVREVEKGYECGMNLDGFNDIKVGDQLEAFMMEEQEVD